MRYIRYTFVGGLFWWGCDASPDSRSIHPDFQSTSAVEFGVESAESDERRGCGEEEDTGLFDEVPLGAAEEIWDTGVYDTGEVYRAE